MIRDLTSLADRSCWISGDRVNACVGPSAHGLIEFGFHGLQPVSRNSRILFRPEGALSIAFKDRSGQEFPVPFEQVDWEPHRVGATTSVNGQPIGCELLAGERAVHLFVPGEMAGLEMTVRLHLDSCFTDVRGERTWDPPVVTGSWLSLSCRDRITLGPWMKQTGPYAGDFLIPEHWRRVIFNGPIRSGLATSDDLRPGYRDAEIPLYDARTWLVAGGHACEIRQNGRTITFSIPLENVDRKDPVFTLAGSENEPRPSEDIVVPHEALERRRHRTAAVALASPQFSCEALPELSTFFGTVPGLVESCTVADVGMTRATPGAYYWLWAWDSMVTGQETLRWGATELAGSTIRYISSHRDIDGRIPARWTRAHEPMDTPPRGALDFLLLHLAYENSLATGELRDLLSVYPHAVEHLRSSMEASRDGLIENLSFYPDRPVAFGRTEHSVVALETGCLYSFARLMDNVAGLFGDGQTRTIARELAGRIEQTYKNAFWDEAAGFPADSFDRVSGVRNETFPLFSLLFLQSSLGIPLIRNLLPAMGRFMGDRLQTDAGTRLLPARDVRQGSEDALGSWYPHWDIYLLKVLRRTGDARGIEQWYRAAEIVLRRLGYVPEFIKLDGLTADPGPAWLQHGAVSNLNCITGWYRGIIEGILGIETDPGGISVIPLGLNTGDATVRGLSFRRGTWDISVHNDGPHLEEIRVDGNPVHGCMKVPAGFHDHGAHELTIRYGTGPARLRFREILNAEVLETSGSATSAAVKIRPKGIVDIVIDNASLCRCEIDGRRVGPAIDPVTGSGTVRIEDISEHELTVTLLQSPPCNERT
jgi:hypothetical protein